ncbi:ATP-binding cassette domain-containing protein [Nocardioides sp. Root151]|uniref:branched-chain amino acid ABC transporter ATP-binding protein/permease n=1 Tax=Nocardioides sp. Root151 TaxID=1736475 RepID=UPI000703647C|nr:branched-chain amino acid ABC transporter ATP-binding protein/permease [Nocardioides sp. Root151]KQZ75650.1 hypothetical protein ASD66_04765 [Nocardioides sp. Root151]
MDDFLSLFGVYDFAVRDALVLVLVALALYVLLSAGIFAVPQVGLMAIGSYGSAILSVDMGVPVALALPAAAVIAGAVGVLLATLVARLNGIYLAIASIAFSEVVRVAVLNVPLTGGSQGKVGISREVTDLWICGAVLLATVALVWLRRSRHGLVISAMRVDTLMAQHQGINVVRVRTLLFGLSGLLSGTAGALQAHTAGFIDPGQFNFDLLTKLLAVVVIGGMTFVGGSFVGALVIFGLPFTLEGFAEYQVLVNGLIIVLVVAFAPGGILGVLSRLLARLRRSDAPGEAGSPVVPGPGDAPAGIGPVALDADDVRVTFGGVHALDGVRLTVGQGEVLGVIGPNGSGKTTLINALSGAYTPSSGTGAVDGVPLALLWGRPHLLARAGIARTFQTIRLMDDKSVAANVALGFPPQVPRRSEATRELLARMGLDQISGVPAGELPYGVRRQVEIARALARNPRVLLLDEPTAGMSPTEREGVFTAVDAARRHGLAVVLVEHDVAMMRRFCDRLMVLDFGRVLAEGSPDDVLDSKEVIDAYIGSGALA